MFSCKGNKRSKWMLVIDRTFSKNCFWSFLWSYLRIFSNICVFKTPTLRFSLAEVWTRVTWLVLESDPSHESDDFRFDLQLDIKFITTDLWLVLDLKTLKSDKYTLLKAFFYFCKFSTLTVTLFKNVKWLWLCRKAHNDLFKTSNTMLRLGLDFELKSISLAE